MKKISVVVPCYNEEKALPFFYNEINQVAQKMHSYEYEFIFVDDGSSDKTLMFLKDLSLKDSRVKYFSFSRNFGKEAALWAGLNHSTGDFVSIMDADLQDPPSLLEEMMKAIEEEGFDCVATRRITRDGEPPIRSFFARCFYRLANKISKTQFVDGARDFRVMTRQMLDAVLSVTEYNRFSKGIFAWVGFKTKWMEFKNVKRVAGETKWSFWKLLLYSLEGIVAYSTAPLAIASITGVVMCIVAIIMIFFIIFKTFMFGDPATGWPSLACIVIFVGGIQLFCTGILGAYLSKTYLETKRRPIYIIKEQNEDVKS